MLIFTKEKMNYLKLLLLIIFHLLDEVDGTDIQKKQLTNPHVELRKYERICCLMDRD